MTMGSHSYQCKLVLLGDAAVGKSSLVLRLVKQQFQEFQEATIGAAYSTYTVALEDPAITIKFEIWDTAGQERYHSLAPMYYRGAQAAVITYDITNPSSFDRAKIWIRELNETSQSPKVIALVGNKVDLEDHRVVQAEFAQAHADEHGLIFMETSAKFDVNVADLFKVIASRIPQTIIPSTTGGGNQTLTPNNSNPQRNSCCR